MNRKAKVFERLGYIVSLISFVLLDIGVFGTKTIPMLVLFVANVFFIISTLMNLRSNTKAGIFALTGLVLVEVSIIFVIVRFGLVEVFWIDRVPILFLLEAGIMGLIYLFFKNK